MVGDKQRFVADSNSIQRGGLIGAANAAKTNQLNLKRSLLFYGQDSS